MIRCRKCKQPIRILRLRKNKPDMIVKDTVYDNETAIHAWNRFKSDVLEREDYYCNYFSFTRDQQEKEEKSQIIWLIHILFKRRFVRVSSIHFSALVMKKTRYKY